MVEVLEFVSPLPVIVDLPSFGRDVGDCEEIDQLMQVDVYVEDGCTQVINASAPCRAVLAPLGRGSNILEHIANSRRLMDWLATVHKALLSNRVSLPICKRYGKVQLTDCLSTLSYMADLEVYFPEEWTPELKLVSFRLWPTWSEAAWRRQHRRANGDGKIRQAKRKTPGKCNALERHPLKKTHLDTKDVPCLPFSDFKTPSWSEVLKLCP
mmetsp:Transcript_63029/g.111954  ORF Transcript_63029/g.111954 Transcript_63029/m.111954 type:complete len:211 (-) Transcript_63029:90-722(-)